MYVSALLRSLAPDDYEVDSIARDCEDNTRGNFCALDTDDMGVTCYTTCIDGLCNDVTRRPTWKDFHRANKEGGSSSKHYNYDYGQSEFAEDEHKERDPYERNRQDESYHPEDVNRSNRPYHPDDRSRQDTAYDSRDRSGQRSPYHPDVRNRFDEHYSSEDKSRHAPFQPEERRRPDVSTRLSSSKEDGIRYGPISEEKGDDNESEKSMPLPKRIENLGINGDDKTMATVAVYPKHSTADMNRSSKDNPRKRPSNNVKGDSKNAREGHPHSNKNDLNRRRGGRKGRLGGEKASGLNTAGSVQPIMWITLAFNFSALVGFLSI